MQIDNQFECMNTKKFVFEKDEASNSSRYCELFYRISKAEGRHFMFLPTKKLEQSVVKMSNPIIKRRDFFFKFKKSHVILIHVT